MQLIDFSGYLLKGVKIIFIYKSTTYKKLEDRVLASVGWVGASLQPTIHKKRWVSYLYPPYVYWFKLMALKQPGRVGKRAA